MKKTYNKYIAFTLLAASLGLSSCDKFLDELPDNRMELQDSQDITDLLVSAYPSRYPSFLLERYSDNNDQFDVTGWNDGEQFEKEAYNWKDITDISTSESPQELWEDFYLRVATANEALKAIEQQGNPSSLNAQRGEALLCRAYSEFMLANVFCNAYSAATADKELGVPYPTEPEEHVGTQYQRGTLKQLYDQINSDIETALPLVQDDQYSQPKFHFTRAAAYAFAAKFNLYYGNYDKAISYADNVLGANAANGLRDWATFYGLTVNGQVHLTATSAQRRMPTCCSYRHILNGVSITDLTAGATSLLIASSSAPQRPRSLKAHGETAPRSATPCGTTTTCRSISSTRFLTASSTPTSRLALVTPTARCLPSPPTTPARAR